MKTTVPALLPKEQDPGVLAARAALAPILARERAIEQDLLRYRSVLDPHVAQFAHQGQIPDELILDARVHLPAAEVEFARTQLERRRLAAIVEQAREAAHARIAGELHAKKQAVLSECARALRAAQGPFAKLATLEDDERNLLGSSDSLAWAELIPSTTTVTSRFEYWCKACEEAGYQI